MNDHIGRADNREVLVGCYPKVAVAIECKCIRRPLMGNNRKPRAGSRSAARTAARRAGQNRSVNSAAVSSAAVSSLTPPRAAHAIAIYRLRKSRVQPDDDRLSRSGLANSIRPQMQNIYITFISLSALNGIELIRRFEDAARAGSSLTSEQHLI